MKRIGSIVGLCLALAMPACGGTEAEDDGINDPFLADGKADLGGFEVLEGTAEGCGVIKLANEANLDLLRQTVHLTPRAAQNIVAYRQGEDGHFDSLAELDAIP